MKELKINSLGITYQVPTFIDMPKVIHLTSAHARYDTRIFIKQCRSLAENGYNITLIVADNNGNEFKDGVNIIDVGLLPGRLNRMLKTTRNIFKKAVALDADVYHFHDPELILTGLKLRSLGKIVIFDIHEDIRQQILIKNYIPILFRRFISYSYGLFEDFSCKKFSGTITPQRSMTSHYKKLGKSITINNYADISSFPKREVDFNKAILFHAGSLTEERGLSNMIRAAKAISSNFTFYLAGELPKDYQPDDLLPIQYTGVINWKMALSLYEKSNIGIILYNNIGQYGMAGSIKSFEYMANSMPFIMPDFGDWVKFNEVNCCGINVNVSNPSDVAEAIQWLIENPEKAKRLGDNGRKAIEEKYNWSIEAKKMIAFYTQLI